LRGNLLVGQSGGATAVINASLAGVVDEAKQHDAIGRVFGTIHGVEGILAGRLIDLGQEDQATIDGLRSTPGAALGSCRYKLQAGDISRIKQEFQKQNIRYFLYIGGNDSADSSHRIAVEAERMGYELRVIGVPKTVDNDLPITDHCPGFGSIARFVALATMDSGRDTEAMQTVDPIKIIEVAGRNAGWVAAASALGKRNAEDAPHLIYFPERPFVEDKFIADVKRSYDTLGRAVIVITETIRDEQGQPVAKSCGTSTGQIDKFGHPRLTGAGEALCQLIDDRLGLRARWEKPGTLARMSTVCGSSTDVEEAYQVGRHAVRFAVAGQTDQMVVMERTANQPYKIEYQLAPLQAIANSEKLLPDNFIAPEGTAVTQDFLDYALPLIGGPLPQYVRLRRARL
jgi:6-phosphofructokinase 1